ncbi:DNA-binding transcriptional regulator CytR [Paeniglutamicibacter psychrophenolicus]|uniref:DNA-binding LacI/PurR family transcriptional regulator n=1 Tax=Paeniglutamicibacter psychrophenolicus TaxID=257454 RepID=A0ABS4WJL0_9MICC|nr:LacI family DNA-binding transcriptional regulator [Paeniglutamicibacter psychrophenolicus]MBP2376392.1 DNA-binding LacI/PurR family transcriptional regulator [Paeniglutamicibacter psychrophenolicus]
MHSTQKPRPTPPSRRRVTAAMVAERAGVSTATVSLVANGKASGRVSATNEAKVREAIRALGYVVDGIGSSLARGVSNTVIMVAPDISNPFFATVIAGVRSALGSKYQLLLSVTDAGQLPSADDTRRLLGLRPAGLLVDAPELSFLEELSAPGPLVLLDAPGFGPEVPAVNLDVAHGARLVAGHLAAAGHKKVAYLDGTTGTTTFELRRTAFLDAAAELGMEIPDGAMASTTINVGVAADAFAEAWPGWKAAGVTAVVCATDTHAYGILQEARAAGISIPGELAVTGFDDLPYSRTSSPSLTSVNLPGELLGRRAAEQLLRLIDGEELETQQVTLESTLMVRGSTFEA